MRSTIIDTVTYLGVLIPFVQGRVLQSLSPRNPTTVAGYTAQGCYTEATQGRALTGTAYYNDQMTVEKCAAACGAYTWFGVEYGRECYCGNNLNAGSFSTAISECNFACPGDSMETCGAGNRLNMYQRPATPSSTSTSVVTTPTPGSYSAQGCYTEATQGRALIGKRYDDDGMTIEKCSAACSGFTYFGLEYYRECYCGNDLQAGSTPASSPSACKYPCQGDNSEICGGDYMLNLYMFGNTPAPSATPASKSYTFDGCFTEATNSLDDFFGHYYVNVVNKLIGVLLKQ
ncbi:MAG: hypothetical protein Q9202_004811 [Teloschistes flavicans]